MRILYSAPLPPEDCDNLGSPGAARKIQLTVSLLQHLGHSVTLLDSSHLSARGSLSLKTTIRERRVDSGHVSVVTPPLAPSRKLGKALQALYAPYIAQKYAVRVGIDCVLLYNAYLFETRVATALFRQLHLPFILQLEDLPWARRRGLLNIKPNIEKRGFRQVCGNASAVLAVNSSILSRVSRYNGQVKLYPPIIDPTLEALARKRAPPFSNEVICIGYFGGLNREKGADKLLDLVSSLGAPYVVHVGGKGDLADTFKTAAKARPDRLVYHGFVPEGTLIDLLCRMDVLVNPHTDLRHLDEGVFPFKLYEYIASGAYVITTKLPAAEAGALRGLCVFDGSLEDLNSKILNAHMAYDPTLQSTLQTEALRYAGFDAAAHRLFRVLEGLQRR